ncbi:MAG: carbamoyltransferase HypF [Gammaproteobacteria bacterium]
MTLPASSTETRMPARTRLRIRVCGAVQGVGFRPFVYRQAATLGLGGWVGNSPEGVTVEAEGDRDRIAALMRAIREMPPPNASVVSIEAREIEARGDEDFEIRASEATGARTAQVLPDLATCEGCLRELFDPADRRYRYPFINCTHCGPRHSIIEDIPYDRARTSMRHFPMCSACRQEYENPADRRFHAEPNACPDCGPRLFLWDRAGQTLACNSHALLAAAAAVDAGRIVAIKGIGGFHLVADARDEAAISLLRVRKRRKAKPFAVMFPALSDIMGSCHVSPAEKALLTGPARPIVLLRRKGGPVSPSVAPGNPWLGALLPYAPLHHLLLRALGFPVVATSGNVSDEPIVTDETAALERLGGIADLFLVHDRPIIRPVDDSVVRVVCGRELVLRRARGYAPAPIVSDGLAAGILALGGHLKTTVALTQGASVVLSQHIGDLGTTEARTSHTRAVADMTRLHAARPRLVVRDLHPDYASSRAAEATGLPVAAVQHHLAHVVACMAEHGITPPVLGVAWDGTGFGPDGTVWGGEFLCVTDKGWRRVAHLRRFRLPGAEAAMREPRRAALGLLYEAFGGDAFAMTDLPPVAAFSPAERGVLRTMIARGVNAPLTSSAGRLFDAFAALTGLRQCASYEGQAAAELEWAGEGHAIAGRYEFPVREASDEEAALVVDWQPPLEAVLADLRAGAMPGAVSVALHNGLAAAIVEVARRTRERRVVLTGGCFQNARLTEATVAALQAAGLEPIWHRHVPPNDGGIALGQAVWAAWTEQRGETPCA